MRYCVYCGRVAHRCDCSKAESRLQKFLTQTDPPPKFVPRWRDIPYKRGVPPQVKRRERATMRKHYAVWFAALVAQDGERCAHCGATDALVIDHVLPIAKGGLSTLDNAQLLCKICNTAKGKLMFDCRAWSIVANE